MAEVRLQTDKKSYSRDEKVQVNFSFRILGGLRESFHPDVWTVSWEDFDKILRLTYRLRVGARHGVTTTSLWEIKKAVRKASFYWSRDPDLPYRIWAMVIPEDGGPPLIPLNVEDAKSKMLDFTTTFDVPASSIGPGSHGLVGSAAAKWGRRSYIEKGEVSGKSKPVVIAIE
jgi:hypothetical protein